MNGAAAMHSPGELRVAVTSRTVAGLHGLGGLERHVSDLVRHLLARGTRITLITQPPHRSEHRNSGTSEQRNSGTTEQRNNGTAEQLIPDELRHPNLRIVFVPYATWPFAGRRGTTVLDRSTAYPLFGYRAGRQAASLVSRGHIDLVHGLGASCFGYARTRRGPDSPLAPLVLNPQGMEEFDAGAGISAYGRLKRFGYAPLQWTVRASAAAANAVIATDRALVPAVLRHLSVEAARVRVIPNAIDLERLDRFRQQPGEPAWPAGERAPVLLSVGRLERNKGFHLLIEALRQTADVPWHWVLIGEGPFRAALESAVDRAELRARVTFAGRTDESTLHASYERATLFVHPSLYEGSSLVTLEAMGHQRAVLTTTAGGLPDKVRPGETGWLVPPGDATRLAASVRQALSGQDRLPDMGRRGRELAERQFAWPSVTTRLLDLYRELLSLPRRSSMSG